METYLSIAAILIVMLIEGLIFAYLLSKSKKAEVKPEIIYPDNYLTPFAAKEIFISFACLNCSQSIVIYERISPGEVAVVNCDYCETSHTVYNSFLRIHKTKELPEPIKAAVAAHFANGGT